MGGLFDQQLFVEHEGKRFGPFGPIGGPIPLHRYRSFKKTRTEERFDRIEALAAKLGVPRAVMNGGQTPAPAQLQDALAEEDRVAVSTSVSIEKNRVAIGTLVTALFCDLSSDKNPTIPKSGELRDRALRALVRRRKKPVVLFIDDAHDLNRNTLIALKRLIDTCAGEGIGIDDVLDPAAVDLLAACLRTPLQIEQHLTLALETGFQASEKAVTETIADSVLSKQIDGVEATLNRNGYTSKVLTEILGVKPAELRALFRHELGAERTRDLKEQMLAAGSPV